MVYYQQQNVALLVQISKQVSSIAPQVLIPSSPPPPYPDFTPNPTDVRVNVYWFMSLVFSLSAALLAMIVQEWVRGYMQTFQRYSNPLKVARLRQYLYEGVERWHMLTVAESVPGLLHASVFLFFVGLIDSLLSLNTTVGITTIVPITICGLFYVLSTFAPIVDPKSSFKTPLSSLIWYLIRKLHPLPYFDQTFLRTVSRNRSHGQVQLAMEENEDRKYRDVRAMQWLIYNKTADDEMDSIVMAIPGAFTSEWGVEVWRMVADDPLVAKRVRHLLDTCESTSEELSSPKRARGCVETVASLVLCANVKLEVFGGLEMFLRNLGKMEKIREISAAGSDGSFVTRWACLYLVVVARRTLNDSAISSCAGNTIRRLSEFRLEDDAIHIEDVDELEEQDEKALGIARRFDRYFESARQICIGLKGALRPDQEGRTEEQVRTVLAYDYCEADISELERALPVLRQVTSQVESIDEDLALLNGTIGHAFLPGVSFDEIKKTELIEPAQFFNIPAGDAQVFMPQIIFLGQRLRLLCSHAQKLRDEQGDGVNKETLDSLKILWKHGDSLRSIVGREHLMERQLWRLLDIRDGGGFGFFVELFFLLLAHLLPIPSSPMPSSQDTHSALYIGTFRAITSDWRQRQASIRVGTRRVILNLICDIAIPHRGVISDRTYPKYITDELLVLLEDILKGQSGLYIDSAMEELRNNLGNYGNRDAFATNAMGAISRRYA